MVFEPRCVKCGRPKLSHTISLLCWKGHGLGYWDTHYEPVSEKVNTLLIKACALYRGSKSYPEK
jgi:hypothetical protein